MRSLLLCLTLLLSLWCGPAQANEPVPSPLRLLPAEADLLLHVPSPGRLIKSVEAFEAVQQFLALDAVKEQLGGTTARRAGQLLRYFEKELAGQWPELLDRLAGGGLAVAGKLGNNAPAVVVVQGRDEPLAERFLQTFLKVVEGELARQEAKVGISKGQYQGITGYRIDNVLLARLGSALVLSNNKDAMARVIALHQGKEGKSLLEHPEIAQMGKLLPEAPLVRGWLNMKPVQASPEGKALYKTPRDDPLQTVLFGPYLDVLGRTPYLCAGLCQTKQGLLLTFRAPAPLKEMGPDRLLHLPPEGQPASRPLLTPPGTLFSTSFYLDLPNLWKERYKIFARGVADNLTQADKNIPAFLRGLKLSTLLPAAGSYHRVVVANPSRPGYTRQARTRIPAFAFITEMNQPDRFALSMDAILRGAAIAGTQQYKLDLAEEKYKECDLVGFRFDETTDVPDDPDDFRFNFSPCYVRVGKQFVFCSTIELGRLLVDALLQEQQSPGKSSAAQSHGRFSGPGFAALLHDQMDSLVLQAILGQAVSPAEAKRQVEQAIALIRTIGPITTEGHFAAKAFRYDVRITLKQK